MSAPPAPLLFRAGTVADAVEVLDLYDGAAKPVSGGTALTLMLRQRLVAPDALVSLAGVPGLRGIARTGDELRIGALTSHAAIARDPLVRRHAPLLAESFGVVGNAQVRAAATAGGVLAEADYASDPPAAFLAARAHVVVEGPAGRRMLPISSLIEGFYETALTTAEVIVELRVPTLPRTAGSAYLKFCTRGVEDRPVVGVAAVVDVSEDGRCTDLRVAVGAASEVPLRLPEIERSARGSVLDAAAVTVVADGYAELLDPIDDIRGSAWYRRRMVAVWTRRAIELALRRCPRTDSRANGAPT